jgi:SAM-dependent methyltransferase
MEESPFRDLGTEQSLHWTNDPWKEKFENIPSIYYGSRIRQHLKIANGARILDYGCGSGLTSTGLAVFLIPAIIDAVDISSYVNHGENKTACIARGLNYEEVLSKVNYIKRPPLKDLVPDFYDAIVSWSVIEHIPADIIDAELVILFKALKKGGVAVFQSAPLYYSAYGSHVYSLEPWFHLSYSEEVSRREIYKTMPDKAAADACISCMETLNRLTLFDFRAAIINAGFTISDEYITTNETKPSQRLLQLFNEEVLLTEQVVFTLTKPSAGLEPES